MRGVGGAASMSDPIFIGGPADGRDASRTHPRAYFCCWRSPAGSGVWHHYKRNTDGNLAWAGECPPENDHHHDDPGCAGHSADPPLAPNRVDILTKAAEEVECG